MNISAGAFRQQIWLVAALLFFCSMAALPTIANAQIMYSGLSDTAAHAAATKSAFIQAEFLRTGIVPSASDISLVPGLAADIMCTPHVIPPCACGFEMINGVCMGPSKNMFGCPCTDVTFGFLTTGRCVAPMKCLAISTFGGILNPATMLSGLGMQLLPGLGMQLGMKLISSMIGGASSGGTGAGSSGTGGTTIGGGTTTGTGVCTTQYFQTSKIEDLSNPCAQYVAAYVSPVSDSINLLQDTGTSLVPSTPSTPGTWSAQINPNTGTTAASLAPTSLTLAQRRIIFQPTSVGGIGVPSLLRGDILARSQDATIIAGSRDEEANVEVSGFYGSQTFGTQSSGGIVGQWCRTRPWSTNFLSKIVPPAFFDGICKARGHQVGVPTPPATSARTALPAARPATTSVVTRVATSAPTVKPRVDIWAVPPSVPLGARTSVFWSTQGVVSCTQTSSGGQFNERSLAGGAATVPIMEATTFYITCLVSDGTTISGSATVHLKI